MKPMILAALTFLSWNAMASTTLFCNDGVSLTTCADIAEAALEQLGCKVNQQATACTFSLKEDPKNPGQTIATQAPYCEISSENCSRPNTGNFGGENCSQGTKTQIPKSAGVHNGYWFGFFGSYSRTVCIVK